MALRPRTGEAESQQFGEPVCARLDAGELRLMVKTILKKWRYPPDRQDAATRAVLDLAKEWSAAWATE